MRYFVSDGAIFRSEDPGIPITVEIYRRGKWEPYEDPWDIATNSTEITAEEAKAKIEAKAG